MSLKDILSVDTGRQQRRRVGRGLGSGIGKTGGRGSKGEGSRTGGKNRGPLFEGGQFPFWMRLPKRGFSNHAHKVSYQTIDLARALKRIKGSDINLSTLREAGLINTGTLVKIVNGRAPGPVTVSRAVRISVHRISGPAKAAVEAAGGSVIELHVSGLTAAETKV